MGQFPAHEQFMRVSNLLIDHELDRDVGARIVVHASAARGDIEERLRRIETVAASKNAKVVEDFFDDLNESEKELALWMILAWYSGSSSSKGDAEVFTYEKALTFKTTSDVVGIPSYGLTGPNLWDRIPSADLIDMPKF